MRKQPVNNKAFSLAEILIACVFAILLLGAVANYYNLTRQAYSSGISEQWLQDGATTVLTKIIEGKTEPAGIFRLSEAKDYTIPNISELHFTGTDDIERWVFLNGQATAVLYHHPTISGTIDEIIYTAPVGSTITLRFSTPTGAQYTGVVVAIDVALTQNIQGRPVSGSASTYVNIRNHAT